MNRILFLAVDIPFPNVHIKLDYVLLPKRNDRDYLPVSDEVMEYDRRLPLV